MSTRKSTRAPRAASEVSGVSVASGPAVTPRGRRGARQSTGPLPAVGTQTSNSYGTNAVQGANRASGPQVSDQITGVLDDLLDVNNGNLSMPLFLVSLLFFFLACAWLIK